MGLCTFCGALLWALGIVIAYALIKVYRDEFRSRDIARLVSAELFVNFAIWAFKIVERESAVGNQLHGNSGQFQS